MNRVLTISILAFGLAPSAFAFIGGGSGGDSGTAAFAQLAFQAQNVDNASGTNVVMSGSFNGMTVLDAQNDMFFPASVVVSGGIEADEGMTAFFSVCTNGIIFGANASLTPLFPGFFYSGAAWIDYLGNGFFSNVTAQAGCVFTGNASGLTNMTSKLVNSAVLSSNWLVNVADFGAPGDTLSPSAAESDTLFGFAYCPCLYMASSQMYYLQFPGWVTNAVVACDFVWANAKPLYWTNFCYNITATNTGSVNTTYQPVYTLNASAITTVMFTNNFEDTRTNTIVEKLWRLWAFYTATNTANTPSIIRARVTATGPIQEGY